MLPSAECRMECRRIIWSLPEALHKLRRSLVAFGGYRQDVSPYVCKPRILRCPLTGCPQPIRYPALFQLASIERLSAMMDRHLGVVGSAKWHFFQGHCPMPTWPRNRMLAMALPGGTV